MLGNPMPLEELLVIVYQRKGPNMLGAITTVDPKTYASAAANGETIELKNWSTPYYIAKHLDGREIVFGSLPYLIGEAVKPIFRLNRRLSVFERHLHPRIRSSYKMTHEKNAHVYEALGQEFPEWFIHRQDELAKEALLLSGLHLRSILDIIKGNGDRPVNIYDHDGNLNGTVTLRKVCNMMMHHRYWVFSTPYIHDLFSDRSELVNGGPFGSRVDWAELLHAMLGYLSEITVNDFVGVLRGQLQRLSTSSAPKDIMLATQNVHALSQIIGDRISDPGFHSLQNFLFRELTADETRKIDEANGQSIELVRQFNVPSFKVSERIQEKRLTMSLTINGKVETFQLDQVGFFDALTNAFGNDPIMTLEKLVDLYDKPEIEVLA